MKRTHEHAESCEYIHVHEDIVEKVNDRMPAEDDLDDLEMCIRDSATVGDYRKATALEALYGYLYLDDRMDRLMELIKISLNELDIHL